MKDDEYTEALFQELAGMANLIRQLVDDANFEDDPNTKSTMLFAAGHLINQLGWMADKGAAHAAKDGKPLLMRGDAENWMLGSRILGLAKQ